MGAIDAFSARAPAPRRRRAKLSPHWRHIGRGAEANNATMPPHTLAPWIGRLPQTLWNLAYAGLVLAALPLVCCALMLRLRARSP